MVSSYALAGTITPINQSTLLIVEDVMADVELMVLALEVADITFTYDIADNHIGCQRLLHAQNYDAVLVDYRLPGLHGMEVLELVKQSEQEIPLILVTGALGEEAAVECIKAGMTDYVLKDRLFRLPMVLERSLQEFELRRQKQANNARIRKEELSLETIWVEPVCRECLSLIQEPANRKSLQVSLVIAPEVQTCMVDQRRLKQILVNLLSNAVKFTEFGSVTLLIEPTEGAIKFSVIDTGIGIAASEQATLFQPFQQLDSDLNRKYEGTGLGLVLSRKLARLHGGDITLHSELGHGSCFTLHLPT